MPLQYPYSKTSLEEASNRAWSGNCPVPAGLSCPVSDNIVQRLECGRIQRLLRKARRLPGRCLVGIGDLSPHSEAPLSQQCKEQFKALMVTHMSDTDDRETKRTRARKIRRAIIAGRTNPVIPRWRDLDRVEKLRAAVDAASTRGGYSFSLNLSVGREWGFAERENAMRGFGKRLSQAFRKCGLPMLPVAVVLEAAESEGKLHMHGVVTLEGHDLRQVKSALMEAGGRIPGRARSRQCQMDQIYDNAGWFGYITKAMKLTSREVPGRLIYISDPMIRHAKLFHEEYVRREPPANNDPVAVPAELPTTAMVRGVHKGSMPEVLTEHEEKEMRNLPFYGLFG